MRLIKLLFASILVGAGFLVAPANAQVKTQVVSSCPESATLFSAGGINKPIMIDVHGTMCTSAALSGSVSVSGFVPGGVYATLTATGSSADVALPAGTDVMVQNTGTTAVSCVLAVGAGTATASKNIIQPGSTVAFTVGSNTHIACIDQTGSTSNVVAISGGAGNAAGWGGGSAGGGGGAVTIADGADVALGAVADSAWVSGNATVIGTQKSIVAYSSRLLSSAAPVAPGAASATTAFVAGGTYNSTPPTLTNTQQAGIQLDANGFVKVNVAAGGAGGGAATVADGADVAEGATTDAAATAGSTGTVSSKLRLMTTQLGTINTTLGTPMQATGGTVTVTQATGTNLKSQVNIASGGVASGAVASGAFASGSVASGALASGSVASGAIVDLGAQADSACGTATGTCSAIALLKFLNSSVTSAIPAGTNVIGKVGIDQTTFGTTNGVVSAANAYETVAASQTAQALGATGATGDYLSHCIATPGTTSPGVVTILDNSTAIVSFAGGASSVSNLVPFSIPIGAISVSGAWKVTTGANITVVCVGKFT